MLIRSFLFLFLLIGHAVSAQIQMVENKGQWDRRVKYKASFSIGSFFLEQQGFSVLLHNGEDLNKISGLMHGTKDTAVVLDDKTILHSHAYTIRYLGANTSSTIVPEKPLNTYNNYFVGNDKSKWASNCKIFQSVTYKNIYNNIDVRY